MTAKPIPEGHNVVCPYLAVRDAAAALEFYKKAFGATERLRLAMPGGKIGHAEVLIGESVIMLADEAAEMDFNAPETVGGTPVTIHLYVEKVDEVFKRALAAGATELRPVEDQFYGDRSGQLRDPFGHVWWIATHIEDVSQEEVERRAKELFGGG